MPKLGLPAKNPQAKYNKIAQMAAETPPQDLARAQKTLVLSKIKDLLCSPQGSRKPKDSSSAVPKKQGKATD
jgi:hypothetical protein